MSLVNTLAGNTLAGKITASRHRQQWIYSIFICAIGCSFATTSVRAQSNLRADPARESSGSGSIQSPGPTGASAGNTAQPAKQTAKTADLKKPELFDGAKAWKHMQAICNIGPRVSTSPGMRQQQQYIREHFKANNSEVLTQEFQVASPFNGDLVPLQNLMVQYHPDRERRLLICCHYDTRPFPDQDKRNPKGKFIGANDGASGVALLCELGRHLTEMEGDWGVDLLFFDGEEFVIARQHPMFLGSTYFAQQYAAGSIPWRYEYAVLVDMVADKDLQIYFEKNSLAPGPDRLTRSIWDTARRMRVREFIPKQRHVVNDDHLPLNNIAKIPTCDIIDFDYPNPRAKNAYWHTTKDTIDNCSQDSLGKVGSVVLTWIREVQEKHSDPKKK